MEFHPHEGHPGVLVLLADAELDSYASTGVRDELLRAIDAGADTLVVDCSRVGYVSTIAVCTLIRLHKRLIERGSELRLAAVQPPLHRVLTMTRLDKVFRLFDSVDDAVQAARRQGTAAVPPRP